MHNFEMAHSSEVGILVLLGKLAKAAGLPRLAEEYRLVVRVVRT